MYINQSLSECADKLTAEKIDAAVNTAISKMKKNLSYFKAGFMPEASIGGVYPVLDHISWVEGFYTGILWLCYELSGDEIFLENAREHFPYFENRINEGKNTGDHDVGFLYTLSCVADYKVTGNENSKKTALKAAESLLLRFNKNGNFIQAWGAVGDEKEYRLIADCLMNIPLLYWAAEETGDSRFYEAAKAHFETTRSVIMREDGSTYHTYFFDKQTGLPKCGKTHQGYKDESAWARGQAWCIYGFALSNFYLKGGDISESWHKVTDYYLNNLPEDNVAYWDFTFKSGNEPRDSSANVIAACGMLEAYRQGMCSEEYLKAAKALLNAVIDECGTDDTSNGLMAHSTYHRDSGADECTPWGDYFYLEALTRLKNNKKYYW